jgi:hypothetical protein
MRRCGVRVMQPELTMRDRRGLSLCFQRHQSRSLSNLDGSDALYNFLSTFSGTHYVTPRSLTAQIGFHF